MYGCLYARGRRYKLGVDDGFAESMGPIRLRGPFAAYALEFDDRVYGTSSTVAVKDLRNGRVLHTWTGNGTERPCDHSARSSYVVEDLAVAPSGAVAWTGQGESCDSFFEQVVAIRKGNRREVLDDDKAIEPKSLRYAHGWIFWRHPERVGDPGQRGAPLP